MFTFVGPLRSTCAENGRLVICEDYEEFIAQIKDYDPAIYEIITGYLSIDDNKFLLCYAADDDATDETIEEYQLFWVIGDKDENMLPSEQSFNAIRRQLNIDTGQDIMFSMLGAQRISENIVRVPIVIVKNDYGDDYEENWITKVIQTNKTFDIVIPDNVAPFEWV